MYAYMCVRKYMSYIHTYIHTRTGRTLINAVGWDRSGSITLFVNKTTVSDKRACKEKRGNSSSYFSLLRKDVVST
ncbi:hypothetical protein POVWA2_012960 [Plasmodium ovale wallikeri]|uniref:Uncharacterized protein n=1 Tax=Plasmodium ovale wallikeri TaxID=864142 RepID=A0A1A8YNC4_PLAOA|nr:hypothetical protein POVWA1_012290 [Plasmodium ovale wallikeri]SBT33091.1 hypothetical protein POVWA2_012960 [Plasmodium ovale wallikeri]